MLNHMQCDSIYYAYVLQKYDLVQKNDNIEGHLMPSSIIKQIKNREEVCTKIMEGDELS